MSDREPALAYMASVAAYYRRRAKVAIETGHDDAPRWQAAWIDRAEATERLAARIEAMEHLSAEPKMPEFWTGYGEHIAKESL
jgi:hypothetical protein